jgi:cytochrome c oxidase assembly protein subunit 15
MAYNKQIAVWLFLCCFMVALMVAIGGVTRLTGSGLSMTDWKPVTGWFPPFNEQSWDEEFTKYRQSPEYQKINYGMNIAEFKNIFWLEFIHRLLGRITGIVFLVPLIFFAYKRAFTGSFILKMMGIFLLGAAQATIGWLMVSSGLKDRPYVSHYWLAFHLCTAFIIFALLYLLALGQYFQRKIVTKFNRANKIFSIFITIVIFTQVFLGGLVAGLDAGLIYNSFPKMEGKLIPDGLFTMQPWYLNIIENNLTVQFTHRSVAFILSLAIILFWFFNRKTKISFATNMLFVILLVQFMLGVFTLLYNVPILLASLHQLGALLLFSISLYINFTMLTKNHREAMEVKTSD